MKYWTSLLKADPSPRLLEPGNPSVRYFTLTDLLERPSSDAEVRQAQAAIMVSKPVQKILDAQYPDGYWVKPDIGYSPKSPRWCFHRQQRKERGGHLPQRQPAAVAAVVWLW